MALIIDIASDPTPALDAFLEAGVGSIFSYLSSINPNGDKCWTSMRVKAATARGFRIGLVHEGWGGVGGKGISVADGTRDGNYCREQAIALGAPSRACVYFACDKDFSPAQIRVLVVPYFQAIRATAMGDDYYRIGVYGSGSVCAALLSAGLVDLTWLAQSRGWAGYQAWTKRADMVQGAETTIAGLDLDPNTASGSVGDFTIEPPAVA